MVGDRRAAYAPHVRDHDGAVWSMKRIVIAVVLAAALAAAIAPVAFVGYWCWWDWAPWPCGDVVEVQGSGWVLVQTEDGTRYRAWVPEDYRSDSLSGEYMQVHTIGSPFIANPVPW